VFRIQEFRIHALRLPSIVLLLLVLAAPVALFARTEPEVRRFTFQYQAVVGPVVKGTGPVERSFSHEAL
jgi:hypothetical protein